jgi:hypothetical protein|eukprot:COSAG01_NODE_1946_length_8829_cov_909.234937_6_plen_107_part_00
MRPPMFLPSIPPSVGGGGERTRINGPRGVRNHVPVSTAGDLVGTGGGWSAPRAGQQEGVPTGEEQCRVGRGLHTARPAAGQQTRYDGTRLDERQTRPWATGMAVPS